MRIISRFAERLSLPGFDSCAHGGVVCVALGRLKKKIPSETNAGVGPNTAVEPHTARRELGCFVFCVRLEFIATRQLPNGLHNAFFVPASIVSLSHSWGYSLMVRYWKCRNVEPLFTVRSVLCARFRVLMYREGKKEIGIGIETEKGTEMEVGG